MTYLASLHEETADKIDGYRFIHTRAELDRLIIDTINYNKVIIKQDFMHEYFTPSGLTTYIDNVKMLNSNIEIVVDANEEVITRNALIDKISKCRNIDEVLMLCGAYEKEFMDTLQYLVTKDTDNYSSILEYSNQVSRLQLMIENLNDTLEEKEYELETEKTNKLLYQSKFHALISRINYQYNADIDKNKLFHIDKNSYDKILYIKEISRVQYVDTLIYYLREILKTLYSMPTRILVVESYYATGKINQYPNLVPHHKLLERDVIKGDILMLGIQPNIMTDILKNSSNISILIVLDRGGYGYPHITGDNVEMLYTVSDLKDLPSDIPLGRVISYSNETQYINFIKDFDKLDASAKISKYSSMPIVKNIISLLEKG